MTEQSRIIVALDFPAVGQALDLVERLDPARCKLKVGKELFTRGGPEMVRRLVAAGYDVFLDLKFHDIPNTVAGACAAAADLGVWMLNVHALGGAKMMEAARRAVDDAGSNAQLIGVTVLTSMGQEDLDQIGLSGTPEHNVLRLARLAQGSGLDGVVCSPREVVPLRKELPSGFRLVTPGIRPSWAAAGDQTRITTPADALADGSDYLVIGRPVTAAADPLQALERIEAEIDAGADPDAECGDGC